MKKIAVLFFMLCSAMLFAQDTIVPVAKDTVSFHANTGPVLITAVRPRSMQSGSRTDQPDSVVARLYPAGTLSDLLGAGGYLNLKSYGPGALATTSARGSNSMQTPVVWNGLNLQNITNNTVDLSLMPTFLFDYVGVQPGNSSTAIGSGAIGGSINVNSFPAARSASGKYLTGSYLKQKAVFEMGSFGAVMAGYQFGIGHGRWNHDVKIYRQAVQNNFWYTNTTSSTDQREQLQHARLRQQGTLLQSLYTSKSRQHRLSAKLWIQETFREIPPTMLQSASQSTQQDYSLRALLDWYWQPRERFMINTRAAFVHEGLLYAPGFAQPISNTTMHSAVFTSSLRYSVGHRNSKLLSGLVFTASGTVLWSAAEVTEYIPYTEQMRLTFAGGIGKYLRDDDEANISVRIESVDGKLIDPVGAAWYYVKLKSWLGLRAAVSHNYRVPTFNDLYWVPGGNRELKPESGWTEEISLETKRQWNHFATSYSVTVYNRNIRNMIAWVPVGAYWSPLNIAEVHSYGCEQRLKLAYTYLRWKFDMLANADYVRSIYNKSDDPNDVGIGNQLIYVPAWFGSATLNAQWTDVFVTASYQYVDHRFTSRDHTEWLPAYAVVNLAAGWSTIENFRGAEYGINVFVRWNNLTDAQYQTVAWRPMPGRNFTVGCTIDFSKQKQSD